MMVVNGNQKYELIEGWIQNHTENLSENGNHKLIQLIMWLGSVFDLVSVCTPTSGHAPN